MPLTCHNECPELVYWEWGTKLWEVMPFCSLEIHFTFSARLLKRFVLLSMCWKCVSQRACPEPQKQTVLVHLINVGKTVIWQIEHWGLNQSIRQSMCENELLSFLNATTKGKYFIHEKNLETSYFHFVPQKFLDKTLPCCWRDYLFWGCISYAPQTAP